MPGATSPLAGHGTLIGMECGATPTPGLFTTLAQQNGDIVWPELSRDMTEITPHNTTIDTYQLSYLKRGEITFEVNFMNGETTHNHLTGLYKMIGDNVPRGMRITENGQTPGAGISEWIMSGQVQKISKKAPVRAGVITASVTFRPSGPQIIDGVVYAS